MIKNLLKLANNLDRSGNTLVADEIDAIIKEAVDIPEADIEEDLLVGPESEKDKIEKEYGLGIFSDDEDSFGLEKNPWHGFEWSYDGLPKDKIHLFKKFERYQTVLTDDLTNLPTKIDDPAEGGFWTALQIFKRTGWNSKFEVVYKFTDPAKEQRRKDIWGDDDEDDAFCAWCTPPRKLSPGESFDHMIHSKDKHNEEVESIETPEDTIEVIEAPTQIGGGVKLF